jgi:Kef-type K+ transport system membrane component KefB
MRDFYVIGTLCVVALLAGGALFFFGPSSLRSDVASALGLSNDGDVSFTILNQGMNARSITDRSNYRLVSQSQLADLWLLVYGPNNANAPVIDFTTYEVLAIFDGSHSTSGYQVQVTKAVDQSGVRTITVNHSAPGKNCSVKSGITSPFVLLQIAKTNNSLAHIDQMTTTPCP